MTDTKTPKALWQNEKTGEPWFPRLSGLEQGTGIEPASSAWEAEALTSPQTL